MVFRCIVFVFELDILIGFELCFTYLVNKLLRFAFILICSVLLTLLSYYKVLRYPLLTHIFDRG